MKTIELMVDEHRYIKRILAVVRKLCYKVLKNEPLDYSNFYEIIDFVRNYADKHHHSKEEAVLFKKINEHMNVPTGQGPIIGMLGEHESGRNFIRNLEAAVKEYQKGKDEARLDIIANAICYTDLLYSHIEKEDNVIFVFAEKNLTQEAKNFVDENSNEIEKQASKEGVQDKYIGILKELESLL
jgi:hemerythrin-like domain-containing protein